MFRAVLLLIWLTTSVLYQPIFAQDITQSEYLELKDGLSDRQVKHIVRQDNGLFWIVEQFDVQSFNGSDFKTLPLIRKTDIQIEEINLVTKANKDYLFLIPTRQDSILKLDLKTGVYQVDNSIPTKGLVFKNVQDKNYALSNLSSSNFQIYIFNEEWESFTSFFHEQKIIDFTIKNNEEVFFIDVKNDLYLMSSDSKVKLEEGVKKIHLTNKNNCIIQFTDNKIFHGFVENGKKITKNNQLGIAEILSVYEDKKNQHLIIMKELDRFANQTFFISSEDKVINYEKILIQNNTVADVCSEDFARQILVGTYNGIYYYEFRNPAIQSYDRKKDIKRSQFGRIVTGISYAEKEDEIFFLKESEQLSSLKKDTCTVLFPSKEFPTSYLLNQRSIFDKENNILWSYSFSYSDIYYLNELNLETREPRQYSINSRLNCLEKINDHEIMFGGHLGLPENRNGKILFFDIKQKKVTREITGSFLKGKRVFHLTYNNDTLWVGTDSGVFLLDKNNQLIENFEAQKTLQKESIYTFFKDGDLMIVGTGANGFYVLKNNKIIKHFGREHGLKNPSICSVIKDGKNNYWLGSFEGIYVFDSDFKLIKKLFDYDGMSHSECNRLAIEKDKKGNLYFGTLNGLTQIDPEGVLEQYSPQNVAINNISYYSNGIRSVLQTSANNHYHLTGSIDSIVIEFDTYDYFSDPYSSDLTSAIDVDCCKGKSNFHLNGKSIIITTPENEFDLNYISKSKNVNGEYPSGNIKFKISSSFINALPYLLLGICTIALITYLILKYVLKQKVKREKERIAINKKISELELNALRSQMNPHFIFNALGAIQYFIQTNDSEKADDYLSDFAMLMRKILESSKSKYITLAEEINQLQLYIGLERVRFDHAFDFNLDIAEEIDTESHFIPSMILQPFVENAINHGLHHLSERKGELNISLFPDGDNKFAFEITDNGIGRQAAEKKRKLTHKSRGMQIIEERIETLNTTSEININIDIQDLYENGNSKGTRVKVSFSEIE